MSGLPTRRFCFEAFLPSDKKEKQRILDELKRETRTIVVYEAPHRLVRTLKELYEALGDREITVCRELTKENEPKGECVIVIGGRSAEDIKREENESWASMSVEEHMEYYTGQGIAQKEAMKLVAKDRGLAKRDIYRQLMVH